VICCNLATAAGFNELFLIFLLLADQVYGDQGMHDIVRKHCMDYMVSCKLATCADKSASQELFLILEQNSQYLLIKVIIFFAL